MRKLFPLCGAVLCFSVGVAAQDNSAAPATPNPLSAASPRALSSEAFNWQIAISYEYLRFREALGTDVNLNGFNTSVTRFANSWFGLEGDVAPLFGHTPANKTAKFLFYGGGPHLAYRSNAKIEPWVHGLFGGAHLIPQTVLGSQNAFGVVAGGGLDFKLTPRAFWRVQGDYVWTRFFSTTQSSYQVKSGIVFNF